MQIAYANDSDRVAIGTLDATDDDLLIVASRDGRMIGYVGVTGPGAGRYPVERHFRRETLPMAFDEGLYEVRIVVIGGDTDTAERPALTLGHAALRAIEHLGGTHLVAIGRVDLVPFYRKLGLVPLSLRMHIGISEFEVMHASIAVLRRRSTVIAEQIERLGRSLEWHLPFPYVPAG